MSGIVDYRKCFTKVCSIHGGVDNFALVKNTLFVTVHHVIVQYHIEMDATNTSQWHGSVGTTDESFCTTSKGFLVSGELGHTAKLSLLWIVLHLQRCKKKLQMRHGVPVVAHLDQSGFGIVPELSNDDADCSLASLVASDQAQR